MFRLFVKGPENLSDYIKGPENMSDYDYVTFFEDC